MECIYVGTRIINDREYEHKVKYIRTKYISPEMKQEMKHMIEDGVKKAAVCKKYNISYPTLKKYMNELDG